MVTQKRKLPVLIPKSFISRSYRPSSKGQEAVVIVNIHVCLDSKSTEARADERLERSSRR